MDIDLLQQLAGEISVRRSRIQKNNPQIKTTEGRPRKYYYSEQSDSAEVAAVESTGMVTSGADAAVPKTTEHDLYPILSSYAWQEFGVYSKRIDEKRSSNKRGPNRNRWLYPDIVGIEDLGAEWLPEVRDCVDQHSDKRTKSYGLSRSNS